MGRKGGLEEKNAVTLFMEANKGLEARTLQKLDFVQNNETTLKLTMPQTNISSLCFTGTLKC